MSLRFFLFDLISIDFYYESFYTWDADSQTISLKRSGIVNAYNGTKSTLRQESKGNLKASQNGTFKAIINLTFPDFPDFGSIPHFVLGTELSEYAVLWSCIDFTDLNSNRSREFVFILTRTPNPGLNFNEKIDAYIVDNNFVRDSIVLTDQSEESCGQFNDSEKIKASEKLFFIICGLTLIINFK